jgi:hypothetical protein
MIKNLPPVMIKHLTTVFNRCLKAGFFPSKWKQSRITMIPKFDTNKHDPNNYRPISVCSSLGKIFERIINDRLVTFLESKNLISNAQSGFRKHRSTKDNLVFITQKVSESFNRTKSVCVLFFDISKAYDKVWHNGLLFKMIKLKIPLYLIAIIKSFLGNRNFVVKINKCLSEKGEIEASLPQGGILCPTCFNIYINDSPQRSKSNCNGSVLYADDLASLFIFRKTGNLEKTINKYLIELEKWLIKWKMKMSAKKCSYITFTQSNDSFDKFRFKLFGADIPYNPNPRFLGITFDKRLSFANQLKETKTNCFDRLKIIRILSHKRWMLSKQTLVGIYKALIGSVIDYQAFFSTQLTATRQKSINVVQNAAVRSICKLDFMTNTNELIRNAKTNGLDETHVRAFNLNKKYFEKAILNENPMISTLIRQFKTGFLARPVKHITPLCPYWDLINQSFP